MNIAELFVNLGVKGSDKAVQAISGVKKNLGEVASMSLEAKAAIIGVIYGLERMMSASARQGTELENFNQLTGLSAQSLQQWQYAARQAGVSSEELTGSLKGVQNSMTNMLLGKGAPEGLAMLANKVGFDPKKARDTFYVMEQLQKFAKTVPADVGNQMIKSFGVSEGTIAAMRRNSFRPEVFARAPRYSDKEINQLDKVNVAWSNLGNKIQMAFGHFTAKNGLKLVDDISKVTTEVIKMTESFIRLAETLKLLKALGMVFEGWAQIFVLLNNSLNQAKSMEGYKSQREPGKGGIQQWFKDAFENDSETAKRLFQYMTTPDIKPSEKKPNQNININNNLNFQHDGKDHKKTSDSVHKAVKDAYRQMQAQTQGA